PRCLALYCLPLVLQPSLSFFFTPPSTTDIYTLSLHDALPIYHRSRTDPRVRRPDRRGSSKSPGSIAGRRIAPGGPLETRGLHQRDRKSTRLNSSHVAISYAVFCLKKKNKKIKK